MSLTDAYATARYRILVAGRTYHLRVGRRAEALGRRLPGVRIFAVITAANPGSRELGDAANSARDLALLGAIDRRGIRRFPGENDAPDGRHREASWLLCDPTWSTLDELAAEFGQFTVLAWQRGDPVALRTYPGRCPRAD